MIVEDSLNEKGLFLKRFGLTPWNIAYVLDLSLEEAESIFKGETQEVN